jgi:hypothetical protein
MVRRRSRPPSCRHRTTSNGSDITSSSSSASEQATICAAQDLDLSPGDSPSSTVTIVRKRDDVIEIVVLGDDFVVLPDTVMTDSRIGSVAPQLRSAYRTQLAAGLGYDTAHRSLLAKLQDEQRRTRNRPGGYWIAEATEEAADQAVVVQRPRAATPWAILATDGAYHTMRHLGLTTAASPRKTPRRQDVGRPPYRAARVGARFRDSVQVGSGRVAPGVTRPVGSWRKATYFSSTLGSKPVEIAHRMNSSWGTPLSSASPSAAVNRREASRRGLAAMSSLGT